MAKMLQTIYIQVTIILIFHCFHDIFALNLTLQHQHPYPQHIVQDFHRRVNASLSRRKTVLIQKKDQFSCVTGNPIDDCWKCEPNWAANRQQLADCAIGFGSKSIGGKGGPIYMVTDSSDPDPNQPKPGTLRDAVSQPGPVWIIFSSDMLIKLKSPLMVTSFKTIDGRGVQIEITGGGCISIEHVTNVIIHNINIHNCYPANSDGDGLHILSSSNIWIDHCTLSNCADGLIDCTEGSTAITISNNYFSHHDKVMLLGHSDDYSEDSGMQITIAFNRFGEALVQRMPRCRFGYFHVVNNDYTSWGEYAIGGSSNPTINSQGNRYIAPTNPNSKEVTKRLDTNEKNWENWNWRTEDDIMVNGAFFVESGGNNPHYTLASSMQPQSASYIDQLTLNAGIILPNGEAQTGIPAGQGSSVGGGLVPGGVGPPGEGGYYGGGGLFYSNAPSLLPCYYQTYCTISFALLFILTFYVSLIEFLLL